jgi:hypothetical protein
MSTAIAITDRTSETLRSAIAGDVYMPGDHPCGQARQACNLSTDQRPAAVAFARFHGMRIAPQSADHGSEPPEPLEGTIRLKTARMRQVNINPAIRTTRAQTFALEEADYLGNAVAGADLIQPLRQASYGPGQAIVSAHPVRPSDR